MKPSGEAPRVTKGLGQYESDYYAVLGIPIMATDRKLRRGYIQAAKALHPDRFIGSPEKIELASWFFSKLVSPASAVLNKPSERKEYQALLRLRMKTLLKEPDESLWPQHELTEKLRKSIALDDDYYEVVTQLAETQYEDLELALERTEVISQINLAYLLLTEGYKPPVSNSKPATPSSGAVRPATQPTPATAPPPRESAGSKSATPSSAPPPAASRPNPVAPPSPSQTPSPAASRPTTPPQTAGSRTSPPARPPEPEPNVEVSPPGMKRFEQAMNMMERRQFKDAAKFFSFAISEDPQNAQFYVQRGIAYQMQRNAALAKLDFQKALELNPSESEARRRLKSLSGPPKASTSGRSAAPATKKGKDDGKQKGLFGRIFSR
ncbi:MAG: DnaJ domain-containing protein [Cyanobacteria bacterium P01_F01_bin.33]